MFWTFHSFESKRSAGNTFWYREWGLLVSIWGFIWVCGILIYNGSGEEEFRAITKSVYNEWCGVSGETLREQGIGVLRQEGAHAVIKVVRSEPETASEHGPGRGPKCAERSSRT